MIGSRDKSIEVHFLNGTIPSSIKESFDIEYSSKEGIDILWIHPTPYYFPFDRELFSFMVNVVKVYNRRTGTDHLDLFIESDNIDEFGVESEGKRYKNIRWSEINETNLNDVKLKRELFN